MVEATLARVDPALTGALADQIVSLATGTMPSEARATLIVPVRASTVVVPVIALCPTVVVVWVAAAWVVEEAVVEEAVVAGDNRKRNDEKLI